MSLFSSTFEVMFNDGTTIDVLAYKWVVQKEGVLNSIPIIIFIPTIILIF